jgi:hypothetical protein
VEPPLPVVPPSPLPRRRRRRPRRVRLDILELINNSIERSKLIIRAHAFVFAVCCVQSPTTTWDSDCSTRFSSQFAIHPPSCFWTKSRTFESDFKEDTLVISWPGFSVVFMLSDEMPDLNLDKPRCRKQFGRVEAIAPTPVSPLIAPRTAMLKGMDDPVPSRDVAFDIICLMRRSSTPGVWHDSSPFI